MRDQPVPIITYEDVERIALRDFGEANVSQVMSLLDEYGKQSWNTPNPRVQAAILKLADGDLDRLREALDIAIQDHRDVLTAAEYPKYNREILGEVDEARLTAVIDDDWRQYSDWLRDDRS